MKMFNSGIYSEEEINLFNPAYCGVLIYEAIRNFMENSKDGMSCTLPYLIFPMAISYEISKALPRSISTSMAGWTAENEAALVDLPALARSYIPVVEQAVFFLLENGVIYTDEGGRLRAKEGFIKKVPASFKDDETAKVNYRAAGFLGRWFSTIASVESIFVQLGVRP